MAGARTATRSRGLEPRRGCRDAADPPRWPARHLLHRVARRQHRHQQPGWTRAAHRRPAGCRRGPGARSERHDRARRQRDRRTPAPSAGRVDAARRVLRRPEAPAGRAGPVPGTARVPVARGRDRPVARRRDACRRRPSSAGDVRADAFPVAAHRTARVALRRPRGRPPRPGAGRRVRAGRAADRGAEGARSAGGVGHAATRPPGQPTLRVGALVVRAARRARGRRRCRAAREAPAARRSVVATRPHRARRDPARCRGRGRIARAVHRCGRRGRRRCRVGSRLAADAHRTDAHPRAPPWDRRRRGRRRIGRARRPRADGGPGRGDRDAGPSPGPSARVATRRRAGAHGRAPFRGCRRADGARRRTG